MLVGAADRILTMAEKQQDHIIRMNNLQAQETCKNNEKIHKEAVLKIENAHKQDRLRVVSAGIVCCLIILCGMIAIYLGYLGYGTTVITTTAVGVIGTFIVADRFKKSGIETKYG